MKEIKTHKQAVKNLNKQLKALKERGYIINAISWFDETHYHINFSSNEKYELDENAKKRIKQAIKDTLAKIESGELKTEDLMNEYLNPGLIEDTVYIPKTNEAE